MRKFVQTLSNSDPWLAILIFGTIGIAVVCAFYAGETASIPADKDVVTMLRGGTKRDRQETRELVAAFNAKPEHSHIYLDVITSSMPRKPDTMLAAGVGPDVLGVPCDRVDYYIASDVLIDLVPYVRQDPDLMRSFGNTLFSRAELLAACGEGVLRSDGTLEEPDFVEAMVAPFRRIDDDGTVRLYAIPVNYTPFIVYYSKDLFDRYNVPYPTENWTWEDLRNKALALTRDNEGRRPDHPEFDPLNVVSYGFQFAWWQHGVECFIRQNGGRMVNHEGTEVVADDPATVEALQFLYDLKFKDRVVPSGVGANTQNIDFTKGTIGMFMWGVFRVATMNEEAPEMDWDVAPLPRKAGAPNQGRASVVFPNGWGITRDSDAPDSSWQWLHFLSSKAGMQIADRPVFLPTRRSVLSARGDVDLTERPNSRWALTHDIDNGYAQPPYSTRQHYGAVYEVINDNFHKLLLTPNPPFEPRVAAEIITRQGNIVLTRDKVVRGSTAFGYVALGIALLPIGYLVYRFVTRPKRGLSRLALTEERWGYALISPWIIGFTCFSAFPILVSILLSFSRWQSLTDFTEAEFVGLANYLTALTGDDPRFWTSLRVTFFYAFLSVPLQLLAGLALAILMNQAVKGITIFRTLYYIPAVLPSVAAAVLWWHLFDTHYGWVNRVLSFVNEPSLLQLSTVIVGLAVFALAARVAKLLIHEQSPLAGSHAVWGLVVAVLLAGGLWWASGPEQPWITPIVQSYEPTALTAAEDVDPGFWVTLLSGGWIEKLAEHADIRFPIAWLSDEHVTPYVFIVMAVWIVGGSMIIYLAGLQGIPTQLYEAAEIDGCTRWQRLRNVTIPMLSPVIFFNLIMGVIGSFQVFNVAFVLFDGGTGPNDSALFYGLHLFREAFIHYRLGYASSLAWILFVIILAFTAFVFKSSPMWVYYESAKGKKA